LLLLFTALSLAIATPLSARTWTEAATGRTVEGTYISADADHVVIKAKGRTFKIAIARLSDADKAFVREQSATSGGQATDPFARITPPVSVKSLPVKDHEAVLEATNNGDQAISQLRVSIALLREDGSVKDTSPHTTTGYFGKLWSGSKTLGKGRTHVIELGNSRIKDDVASVAGVVSGVTWEDGTTWPAWTGPAPQQEGDAAVSLVMKGLVGEGDFSLPLIGCFNHSNRKIQRLMYRIVFLDAAGNELLNKRWGAGSVDAGQGAAFIGFEGPPKGAAKVKLSLLEATFENSPGAATYSPLTAAQIGSRKEVSGGNWTVSFEEELYLGFAVQTSKDGKSSQQFYWSAKPSRSHKFHYDHQEKGGDHEVTFSPAGDGSSGITSRFSDPPVSSSQSMLESDREIRPAGGRIGRLVRGRQVRGPDTLYSMRGLGSEPVFILRIVFTNDTAAAEQALREVYDQ
jgi:hypothetical protein